MRVLTDWPGAITKLGEAGFSYPQCNPRNFSGFRLQQTRCKTPPQCRFWKLAPPSRHPRRTIPVSRPQKAGFRSQSVYPNRGFSIVTELDQKLRPSVSTKRLNGEQLQTVECDPLWHGSWAKYFIFVDHRVLKEEATLSHF